jgi:hypothetical protein
MTTAVDRLVDDAWVAVAMFLSHRALLVLSLASRGLRRTALSNGIWEWVLRRDFSKRIVQAAEQAPLWWIPAGGMPAATDERQFVRCYFRLLRSTPPRAKDVHPSQVVKMDAMLHLPRTRWRPATQVALLLTSIASAWCPTSRHASTADDDAQHCDDTRQAFKQNTGVINIESASSRPSERRATKAIAFQALSYARCVVMSSGLLYVPVNVNHPDIRRYALDRSSLGVILQDDPERLQCMSTEEQLELIDRKLDPLLGYALACQRLRERRLSRALWTIGASLSVVAFDGVRIARFLPSTMVGIIDSGLSLAAYGLVTLRIACFRLHELMGEGKVWSQAADANSMLQWSAEDVITYLRGHDQAQMVAMLDVLASMSQPLRSAPNRRHRRGHRRRRYIVRLRAGRPAGPRRAAAGVVHQRADGAAAALRTDGGRRGVRPGMGAVQPADLYGLCPSSALQRAVVHLHVTATSLPLWHRGTSRKHCPTSRDRYNHDCVLHQHRQYAQPDSARCARVVDADRVTALCDVATRRARRDRGTLRRRAVSPTRVRLGIRVARTAALGLRFVLVAVSRGGTTADAGGTGSCRAPRRPRRRATPPSLAWSDDQRDRCRGASAVGERGVRSSCEGNGLSSAGAAESRRPYAGVRTLWAVTCRAAPHRYPLFGCSKRFYGIEPGRSGDHAER